MAMNIDSQNNMTQSDTIGLQPEEIRERVVR